MIKLIIRVRSLPGDNYFFESKMPDEEDFQPMYDFVIDDRVIWESSIGVASKREAWWLVMHLSHALGVTVLIQKSAWKTINGEIGGGEAL